MHWPIPSLRQALSGARQTFLRFPLTLLAAIVGTVTVIYLVDLPYGQRQTHAYLEKLVLLAALGLVLFLVLQLLAERFRLGIIPKVALLVAGLASLTVYYLALPDKLLSRHLIQLFLLLAGLHLTVPYALYINRALVNSFWEFNKQLFLRLLTAALYTAVLFLGLVVALVALQELFGVDLNSDIYAQCWFLLVGIFQTWFFLAGVPANVNALETETTYPKGLKVFTQFVLLPLVVLYLGILYAYLGKIIAAGEWPRGWVSNLVLGFSVVGIFSLLLIYPIRFREGNAWIRIYARWFYRALFPLLILLTLAIWRRVREYGITESRYVVLVLAGWLCLTAIYFLLSKSKNLKFIPVTLSLLAFLISFGPWGILAVSENSQTNRLAGLLHKYNLLENGRVKRATLPVSNADLYQISSMVQYLGQRHQYASIKPWFNGKIDSILARQKIEYDPMFRAPEVLQTIGLTFKYTPDLENLTFLNYRLDETEILPIKGYEYLWRYVPEFKQNEEAAPITRIFQPGKIALTLRPSLSKQQLVAELSGERKAINLRELLQNLAREKGEVLPVKVLTRTLSFKNGNIEVVFQNINGELLDGHYHVNYFEAWVLVSLLP